MKKLLKEITYFLIAGTIPLLMQFMFAMLGFNPDGWYCGWFSCMMLWFLVLWVVAKEEQ